MSTQEPLNLEQLAETYEVIGELAGRTDARTFMGRRRQDGLDVLIAVSQTPQGDEGNALSHLAADVNLLSGHSHRNVLPIVEGRWVGTDAFAVVTERVYAPTLQELLARRDEAFDYPRIAAILREVNGALEWAREQKVVHRAVALDTIFVEAGSDRVFLSFVARSLPLSDMPGVEEDVKLIAVLARAMLTRSTAAPERAHLPLAELRPGLPALVVAQTEALLQLNRTSEVVPDVSGYIAAIAMADALKDGDIHLEKARHVIEEQQRQHREQLDKERKDHDQALSAERQAHERDVTEQSKRFQKEREEFERQLTKERQALAKEREALAKERAAHAKDREALVEERAAHERDVTEVRERLEWETAAVATQAELYAQTAEVRTPVGDDTPMAVPAAKRPTSPRPTLRARPTRPKEPAGPAWWTRAWQNRPHWRRPSWDSRWTKGSAVAGLVLLVGASAIAIGRNRGSGDASPSPRDAGVTRASAASVVDSVAGGVGRPFAPPAAPALNVPVDLTKGVAARAGGSGGTGGIGTASTTAAATSLNLPVDFVTGVASRAALSPAPAPRRERPIRQEPGPAPPANTSLAPQSDTTTQSDSLFRLSTTPVRPDSAARRDSLVNRDSLAKRDTVAKRDTLARPRPDSVPKRDTIPRDTLVQANRP